jgi:hypothetical protein
MSDRRSAGQATTEYLLLLSFLGVALVVAAYAFIPGFTEGVEALGEDGASLIGAGAQNGRNDQR